MTTSEEKDVQKDAVETAAPEGVTKAESFRTFLTENDLNYFEATANEDENHTTVFRARIEAQGQLVPMAVFIDDSIYTIVRAQLATGITTKNVERIKNYLNELNAKYKIFKYYLREDGDIYLDICIPFVAATFDGRMVQTIVSILAKHLEEEYGNLMAEIWAKD